MEPNTKVRRRSRTAYVLLAATMLLTTLGSMNAREARADSQTQVDRQPASFGPLVIQGRITAIQGALVTVKTPDGYPGGPGIHAQFVTVGPTFKVDVSRARLLLPDGKQADKVPLAVGDRVLMVLSGPGSESPAPGSPQNVNQTYFASIIERVVSSDKIITH
ncbi:MAG: hypothetical protein WCC92_17715 [Candidatus Korobacteraceae bacterium]